MISYLHRFIPQSILFDLGPITIYWYGLFLVLAMAAGIIVTLRLSPWYNIDREKVLDLAIWLIIGGIVGARLYEIFLELPYYAQNPGTIFRIWEGGLAIHGGIIGGGIALLIFTKIHKLSFLKLGSLAVPGLVLGQAIGRWGNWFNQELFGLPTNLPWGIPIALENRPLNYLDFSYFHPTFLYESLGCVIIFSLLITITYRFKKTLNKQQAAIIFTSYLISYSLLRFSLEFIKIDVTPLFFGIRWPQVISLLIIVTSIFYLFRVFKK